MKTQRERMRKSRKINLIMMALVSVLGLSVLGFFIWVVIVLLKFIGAI